jgi:sortase A
MTEPGQDQAAAPPAGGRRAAKSRVGRPGGRPSSRRPRGRVSVVGVLGELLITAGVLVLAFLGWQQYLDDLIVGHQLYGSSTQQESQWDKSAAKATVPKAADPAAPPVMASDIPNAQRFALLIVPRFGADYSRPIAQGVGAKDVLNHFNLGHYPTTQMPGAIGNFAIASHRKAYGGNLEHINELKVGDHIFVATQDGWYQYEFRNLHYVQSTAVQILDPVPEQPGLQATDRMITLQSCNPFFSTAERIIAYGSFDKFYPRADGPPAEIAATVNGAA